jgi:cytochrome o ubiquinol oxidase subunit 1
MILTGVLFGFFAGFTYWFPKFTGFKLNERLGKYACWCWIVGFLLAFTPLYILGFMGATRRLDHYEASTGWQPLFLVSALGALIIIVGLGVQIWQIIVSIRDRKKHLDTTGDPWNARTLEWATASPPAPYNFAVIPEVHEKDAFWEMKHSKERPPKPQYTSIHMPKNTPVGLYVGALSFIFGFAAIWLMTWLAALSFIGIVICLVVYLSKEDYEYTIPASEVAKIESARSR